MRAETAVRMEAGDCDLRKTRETKQFLFLTEGVLNAERGAYYGGIGEDHHRHHSGPSWR